VPVANGLVFLVVQDPFWNVKRTVDLERVGLWLQATVPKGLERL
jgi:hypothetical protein